MTDIEVDPGSHTSTGRVLSNPFLACDGCGLRVSARPASSNQPCGCRAGYHSLCPSWSPVDGCGCLEAFGTIEHGRPQPDTVRPHLIGWAVRNEWGC